MRSLSDLVKSLTDVEAELWMDDGSVRYQSRRGGVTLELAEEIRAHESELAGMLRSDQPCSLRRVPRLIQRNIERDVPATAMQVSLIRCYERLVDLRSVHLLRTIPVIGATNEDLIRVALGALLSRHSVLRSRFSTQRPGVWVVNMDGPPLFDWIDCDHCLDSGFTSDNVSDLVSRIVEPRFDLESGPLVRAALVRLTPQHHILALVLHHVIADAWSMRILQSEFTHIHSCLAAGSAPALPPLTLQYSDFAVYQAEWVTSEEAKRAKAYWNDRLRGVQGVRVPARRPGDSDSTEFVKAMGLDELETAKLKQIAQDRKGSLFVVVLSALMVVLHKWTLANDLISWVSHLGRSDLGLLNTVGCFFDLWVLRAQISPDDSFADIFKAVQARYVEALTASKLSVLHIPPPPAADGPLLMSNVNYMKVDDPALAAPRLSLYSTLDPALFLVIQFECFEGPCQLSWVVRHSPVLVSASCAHAISKALLGTLQLVVSDPSITVASLPNV